MGKWLNFIWWSCFIALAICVQAMAPGLDVLVVGLLILLQEDDYRDMLWLAPLFVFLQEGIGTRPFGSIIVWYAATVVIYKIGRWFFATENFLFMFLLSACLGGAYFIVAWLMAPLQNLAFNIEDTLDKSLIQAIFLPFAWQALAVVRGSKMEEPEKE